MLPSVLLNTSSRLFYDTTFSLATNRIGQGRCNGNYQLYNYITVSGYSTERNDAAAIHSSNKNTVGIAYGQDTNIEIEISSVVRTNRYSVMRQLFDYSGTTSFILASASTGCKNIIDPYDSDCIVFLEDCSVINYEIDDLNVKSSSDADAVTERATILVGNYSYFYPKWSLLYTSSSTISKLAIDKQKRIYVIKHSTATPVSLLYSEDNGLSWNTITLSIPSIATATTSNEFIAVTDDRVFLIVAANLYVFNKATILEATGTVYPMAFTLASNIVDIYHNDDIIYAITASTMYMIDTELLTITQKELPTEYIIGINPYTPQKITGVDDDIVIALATDSMLANIDSDTYQMVSFNGTRDLTAVAMSNKYTTVLGADDGTVITVKYTGTQFVECNSANISDAVDIEFLTNLFGALVTSAGNVFITATGASTWKEMDSAVSIATPLSIVPYDIDNNMAFLIAAANNIYRFGA